MINGPIIWWYKFSVFKIGMWHRFSAFKIWDSRGRWEESTLDAYVNLVSNISFLCLLHLWNFFQCLKKNYCFHPQWMNVIVQKSTNKVYCYSRLVSLPYFYFFGFSDPGNLVLPLETWKEIGRVRLNLILESHV